MSTLRDDRLAHLLDRQAVVDRLVSCCRALDRLDWSLLRDCYHLDAVYDDGAGFHGSVIDFLGFIGPRLTTQLEATMHTLANVHVVLRGDRATTESQVIGWHRRSVPDGSGSSFEARARYLDSLERREDGVWRISRRSVVWESTGREAAEEADKAIRRGRRDNEDLSYQVGL